MALINERQRVNLFSFFVSLGMILVAVELSNGNFATRINKISENLDKALSAVMDDKSANFTDLTDNATYISDTTFNPRGMAGLYNLTVAFMELIFPKKIYPEGFISIENNELKLGDYKQEWQSLLTKYAGLLTMIILLALIIVFMPLCGLCFCCCRCCGKCGARSQPFDKKHDLCKKIVLATLLIGLGTLLLFGVVCAFVSNQQMEEGVTELTDNLRDGIKDVNTYLDTTNGQIRTLLDTNYKEFEHELIKTIDDSSQIVYNELLSYSNATSMTEMSNVVISLPKIQEGFQTLKYSTNSLRNYASQLSDAVRKVKKDLLQIISSPQCNEIRKCKEINQNISSLQTNIHFNNLPDITNQINNLEEFTGDRSLTDAVTQGMNKLKTIETDIGTQVNKTLNEAYDKINDAGKQIQSGAENITKVVNDLKRQIDENTRPSLDTADKYIDQYGPYRYYVGIAISCLLLLISLFIALGLICGICGKRPDGYGDDCCNKGAGSQFLICAVMLMFLTGFIIALVILASFLVGLMSQRVVCDPLRDPANSQIFELINQLNFSDYYIDFNISDALIDCYKNKSLYQVFHLKNKFDLDEVKNYVDKFDISDTLKNLDLGTVNITTNFTFLNETQYQSLENLAASSFEVNFDEFKDLLHENFTTANLSELANELGNLIDEIKNKGNYDDLVSNLTVSQMNIQMYQEKIVQPMVENATNVVKLARKLEEDLKLNHKSFNEAITEMIKELHAAEQTLAINGTKTLKNIALNFTNGIITQIQRYLDRVVDKTSVKVGQCGPLSLVINATLTSTCDKILLPWNGFWFGLFWSLLLFIPTIIVSVKLATLYQKHSAYSRELVEAEYLYDAYVDRDNIPLNRNGKIKKKNKKHKRYEDRPIPSAGGDMVTREYAAGSNHQDTRQWEDFPAGGPPQYQRAPTEYERPPPYYYPGAGENTQ